MDETITAHVNEVKSGLVGLPYNNIREVARFVPLTHWQERNLVCECCGTTKSVKYGILLRTYCNVCVLPVSIALERWLNNSRPIHPDPEDDPEHEDFIH
jgi:hypothetical protein